MTSEKMPIMYVVDDDPEDQLLIRTAVHRAALPLQVKGLRNGDMLMEALANLTETRNPLFPGLIILLDLNMPGKDGRACLRELKTDARWSDIPIVVFSTSDSPEDIQNCYQQKANAYICKPDDLTRLELIVTTLYQYWFERSPGTVQEGSE